MSRKMISPIASYTKAMDFDVTILEYRFDDVLKDQLRDKLPFESEDSNFAPGPSVACAIQVDETGDEFGVIYLQYCRHLLVFGESHANRDSVAAVFRNAFPELAHFELPATFKTEPSIDGEITDRVRQRDASALRMMTAFPASLTGVVTRLKPLLSPDAGLELSYSCSVLCAGETLVIPLRIYSPPPSEDALGKLDAIEQIVVACWFTRHHDGYVRERYFRTLRAFDSAWIIAYVVALCGEHVTELLRCVWERRELFDRVELGRWLRENEAFYAQTRSRIVSYWNCYHRLSFPRFGDYIGSQLISFFDASLAKPLSTG